MSKKTKPETLDEAVELAKKSPGHTLRLILPLGKVTIHVDALDDVKNGSSHPFTLKGSAVSLVDNDHADLEESSKEIAKLINKGIEKTAKEI